MINTFMTSILFLLYISNWCFQNVVQQKAAVKHRSFRFRTTFSDRKASPSKLTVIFGEKVPYAILQSPQVAVAKSDWTSGNRVCFANRSLKDSRQWNGILLSGTSRLRVILLSTRGLSLHPPKAFRFVCAFVTLRKTLTFTSLVPDVILSSHFRGLYAIFLALDPLRIRFRLLVLLVSSCFFFPRRGVHDSLVDSARRWSRC